MKKFLAILLALIMVLSLVACGGPEPTEPPTDPPTDPPTNPPTDPPTEPPTDPPTEPPTDPPTEPPMTVDTLLDLMEQSATGQVPTRYTINFGFDMSLAIQQEGMSMDMEIGMAMDMENNTDPDTNEAYSRSTTSMSMMGISMEEVTKTYTTLEDGVLVVYTHSNMTDTWTRSELEEPLDEPWRDLSNDVSYEGTTLDDETKILEDRECYVLRCENIREVSDGMRESMGDMDDFDFADAKFPSVVYVDTQTYQILKIEADMSAMIDILTKTLAESALGEADIDADIKTSMTNVVVNFTYEPVEVPPVPQEAFDYLENAGKLTLVCGEATCSIALPEGWNGEAMNDNAIAAYNSDFTMMTYYMYLEDVTRDDIVEMAQMDVDGLKDSDIYVSHGEGPAIEGYETMEVLGDGVRTYFAWAEFGEGYLLVYIMDYSLADEPATLLQTMVDCLSPVVAA